MADQTDLQTLLSDDQQVLGADLSQAQLQGVNLKGKCLIQSNFSKADLSGAILSHADLSQVNFEEANLSSCDLRESDFTYSNLQGADLSEACLAHALLYDATLANANLSNADLRNAVLSGVDLTQAQLSGANFSQADLSGVDLREVDLRNTTMTQADLSDADLRGVDLQETDLTGAILVSAKCNKETLWPEGLEPDDVGVRWVGWEYQKDDLMFFLQTTMYWSKYSVSFLLLAILLHAFMPTVGFIVYGFLLLASVFLIYMQMPKSTRFLQSHLRRISGEYNKKVGQYTTLGLLLNLIVMSVVLFGLFSAELSFRWGGFQSQDTTVLSWIWFSATNIVAPILLDVPEKFGIELSSISATHFLSQAYVLAYQLFIDLVLLFTFVRYWQARTEEARVLRQKTILANK